MMKYVYCAILFIFSELAFYYATRSFYNKRYKKLTNFMFSLTACSSGIWCFGYGLMMIVQKNEYFLIARSIGLFGLFTFLLNCQILLSVIAGNLKKLYRMFIVETIVGIPIFISVIDVNSVSLTHTEYGIITAFKNGTVSMVYTVYMLVEALIFVTITIMMVTPKNRGRVRAFGQKLLLAEGIILVGMFVDTVLPAIGVNYNIPASSMMQFLCLELIYYALHVHEQNILSPANMTGYMMESIKSPILIFNEEGRIAIANREAKKIFEIDETGENADFWEENFGVTAPENVNKTEDTLVFDFELKKTDCHLRLYIDPIYDFYKDYQGYIMMASDITLTVHSMEESERSKNEAEKANAAKSLFLANMSHEIRTPMNSILGFSELALRDDVGTTAKEYFNDIHNSAQSLLAIINDILDISKIESGKMTLVCDDYGTAELFEDISMVIGLQATKKGLELKKDIDKNFPSVLYGDRTKIRQILINILNNGVKYTQEGFVKFKASYEKKEADFCTLTFEISDSGIGIKKEDMEHVFSSFSRVDEKLNSKTEGTGLGLSITKGFVDLMGGTITLESIYGVGSIFTIKIDQRIVDERPVNLNKKIESTQDNYDKKFTMPNANILVVDDTPTNLKVVQLGMKNYGCKIETATSGQEAINLCKENEYDLVLMDHMMPNMDGIEAMHIIREIGGIYGKGGACKIVALTANVVGEAKNMLLKEGFDGFVGKPINFKNFEKNLKEFIPKEKQCFEK